MREREREREGEELERGDERNNVELMGRREGKGTHLCVIFSNSINTLNL